MSRAAAQPTLGSRKEEAAFMSSLSCRAIMETSVSGEFMRTWASVGTFGLGQGLRLGLMWVVGASLVLAQGPQAQGVWVRPFSAQAAAVYLTLVNPTAQPVRVIGGETPAAQVVQMWQSLQARGPNLHRMGPTTALEQHPVEALEVPAGGRLELAPGGLYLLLLGLKKPLVDGETVRIALRLEDGTRLEAQGLVKTQ